MESLKKLLSFASTDQIKIKLAILFSILNKVFDLAPPFLIGVAVDVVSNKESSWLASLGLVNQMDQLWGLAAMTVVIWGLESLFEYGFAVFWRQIAQNLQNHLRISGFAHLQSLDLQFFEEKSTGGLMSILNDDVNQLERFLDNSANDLIQVVTTVICVGAAFFYWSWKLAIFSFLPIPLILWGSFLFQKKLGPKYNRVRKAVESLSGNLSNSLQGIFTIKSFATEAHEVERLRKVSDEYSISNQEAIKLSAAFAPLIRMVVVIGFVSTLVLGGYLVSQGELGVGIYAVLVFITQRLLWPLTRLGSTFDQYQRAMASAERVFQLFSLKSTITDGNFSKVSEDSSVKIKNLHFSYSNGLKIINGINIEIPSGKSIAIVGATGGGKSTLIKLLLKLYEPNEGSIEFGGVDLKRWNSNALRNYIGVVAQDTFLFHGTIYENILYGSFNATEAEVKAAAKAAEADRFIESFPLGFDTIVGERGQKLSGGQKQRIALARAILKNPQLLILDEATSNVDNETEAAIQRSLKSLIRNRTTIIVAHRLSTIRNVDCIYVLNSGQISEIGNHDELIKKQGLYFQLWNVQTGINSV